MATTRIIPLHLNKGKTINQCLADRTDYAKNPMKTDQGNLVSSFACDPDFVASEFALSKKEYHEITGRYQESDVIAYQIRQAFKPGEVSPEEANRIGYEFAERFLKGNHAFIVCTHIDKAHIHNHIIWNSTALDCTRKFRNFWGSTAAVRKLSDLICAEHRLSVIENPARHGKSYNKWLGNEYKLSNRDLLRVAIDQAIQNGPKDVDELIRFLKEAGYTVKRGKYLSFRPEGQKQFIRLRSLGEGYSEDDLLAVLKKEKKHIPFEKKKYPRRKQKTTLVSQLEAKINTGKGFGYDQTMKVIKFKQMAKTMVFAEEKGYEDFAALARAAADAESRFYELKTKIKTAENRMVEIQTLKTHIINYIKTKEVWDGYRKSGYSKKYLAEHEGEIILHRASKKAFDDLGLKKLPTFKNLNSEFATLLAEKKAAYAEYHAAQNEMRELMIHKANAEYILGIGEQTAQRKEYQYE
ncbi:MAG: relaxase/mobilization nuclease domain-containing protein [Christensenellales bacterium]